MDEAVSQHKDMQDKMELLLWAAARGLTADAQELISSGVEPACRDKNGRTAAHYAAAHGHANIAEFLSTCGCDLDAEDSMGRSPLHYAALGDHAQVVELICSKGVWVDAPDGSDDTPLHLACRGLPLSIDQQIPAATTTDKKAAAAAAGVQSGLTSRTAAVVGPETAPLRKTATAVAALIKAGAKTEIRNARGLTPLGEAVVSNNAGAVALLLDNKAMATITVKGYSLLHIAAALGHVEVLERLIVAGRLPDLDSHDNPEGSTALHAACQQGQAGTAQLLITRGADPSIKDAQGRLPHELISEQDMSSKPQLADLQQALMKRVGKSAKAARSTANPASPANMPTQESSKQVTREASEQSSSVQDTSSTASTSSQEQFKSSPKAEQERKVLAWSKLPESELRLLPFPPATALPALQALRKAVDMHTCWEAVAAIRQDERFQEDARDPGVKAAIEDLKRPGVDTSKYAKDSQVQAVFAKMNKLYAILRIHGPGFKVSLDDLLAKKNGPSSVPETLRQLQSLKDRMDTAREAAIQAVSGLASNMKEDGPAKQSDRDVQSSGLSKEPLQSIDEGQETPPTMRDRLRAGLLEMGWQVLRALGMACIMLAAMWIMGMMPDQLKAKHEASVQQMQQTIQTQQLSSVDSNLGGMLKQLIPENVELEGFADTVTPQTQNGQEL